MTLCVIFYPYHFVRTILSMPFCPISFCPYTILSIPFCPLPFCPRTLRSAPDTARIPCRSLMPKRRNMLMAVKKLCRLKRSMFLCVQPLWPYDNKGGSKGRLDDCKTQFLTDSEQPL